MVPRCFDNFYGIWIDIPSVLVDSKFPPRRCNSAPFARFVRTDGCVNILCRRVTEKNGGRIRGRKSGGGERGEKNDQSPALTPTPMMRITVIKSLTNDNSLSWFGDSDQFHYPLAVPIFLRLLVKRDYVLVLVVIGLAQILHILHSFLEFDVIVITPQSINHGIHISEGKVKGIGGDKRKICTRANEECLVRWEQK